MWACQWRELRPMVFGGGGDSTKIAQGADRSNGRAVAPSTLEEGEGFVMGKRQSGGRDGAGTYEMVGMAPRESS